MKISLQTVFFILLACLISACKLLDPGKNKLSLQDANFIQDSLRAMEMLAAHGWLPPVEPIDATPVPARTDTTRIDTLSRDTLTGIAGVLVTDKILPADSVPKPRKPRKPRVVAKDTVVPAKPRIPMLTPIALPPIKEPVAVPVQRDSL